MEMQYIDFCNIFNACNECPLGFCSNTNTCEDLYYMAVELGGSFTVDIIDYLEED